MQEAMEKIDATLDLMNFQIEKAMQNSRFIIRESHHVRDDMRAIANHACSLRAEHDNVMTRTRKGSNLCAYSAISGS